MLNDLELFLRNLEGVEQTGTNCWKALCPAHSDHRASLSVTKGQDGKVLMYCHAECKYEEIMKSIEEKISNDDTTPTNNLGGLKTNWRSKQTNTQTPPKPLRPPTPRKTRFPIPEKNHRLKMGHKKAYSSLEDAVKAIEKQTKSDQSTFWTYHTAAGQKYFAIVRLDKTNGSKEYRTIHKHIVEWKMGGQVGILPLYHIHKLEDAKRVVVTEGEKAADIAWSLGFPATTSAHGAKSVTKSDWSALEGVKEVFILPDNDEPGKKFAHEVAFQLMHSLKKPVEIKVIELPGLPAHGDIEQFVELRGESTTQSIKEEIEALIEAAPIWQPSMVTTDEPFLVPVSEIKSESIDWLWPERIPLGKLTMLIGDPNKGKTFLTMDMAARVSSGSSWPDISEHSNQAGDVIILSAEDDFGDTLRPRLDAAGADVNRIFAFKGVVDKNNKAIPKHFDVNTDLPVLEKALEKYPNTRLVIIDPITAYLGNTDSYKNAEVRGVLAALADTAARQKVAIVAISHFNKNSGQNAIHRNSGSLAFTAAPRAIWMVADHPDDTEIRVLIPIKLNIAKTPLGMAFRITDELKIEYEDDPVELSADDALNGSCVNERKLSALETAEMFLKGILAFGPQLSDEIYAKAKDFGISEKTIERARKSLNVKAIAVGAKENRKWHCELPSSAYVMEDANYN